MLTFVHFLLLSTYHAGDGSGAFVARSAIKAGDTIYSGGTWHNSTTKPGWLWKGDTSSDEITGHMFLYPLVQALVPALNASLLSDVKSNTHQLVKGLIASNFTLIDPATDKPTTWGLWTPEAHPSLCFTFALPKPPPSPFPLSPLPARLALFPPTIGRLVG